MGHLKAKIKNKESGTITTISELRCQHWNSISSALPKPGLELFLAISGEINDPPARADIAGS
jgi:hypothetical protein